ncbi:hypothetical protein [Butyrivibrio sp. FCS014]|uniref:hypothetical protein n=1 Tax=Butyrivibrio sp. FCS014 TaxID=1408304 RepID=UPI0004665CFD|nr:hypothetical protein [Butyrivibrio sp. FCS014]
MKKSIIAVLVAGMTLSLMGCGSESENAGFEKEPISAVTESADPYAEFIAGNNGLYLDYYDANVLSKDGYGPYIDDVMKLIPGDKAYTLSELKDELNGIFANEDNFFAPGEVTSMSYSFLDCGNDGEKEMALKIQGPFVEPESEATFVIKNIGGKLEVVYAFTSWSRSFTEITEYGLVSGGGSNGATNHGTEEGFVNADGVFKYGYYEEEESDVDSFGYIKEHDEFDASTLPGILCVYTLRVGEYNVDGNEMYYSYKVYDPESYLDLDVPDLYTDSEYKAVMDCFHDVTFMTYEEMLQKENAIMESIGVNDTIRAGRSLDYKEITQM